MGTLCKGWATGHAPGTRRLHVILVAFLMLAQLHCGPVNPVILDEPNPTTPHPTSPNNTIPSSQPNPNTPPSPTPSPTPEPAPDPTPEPTPEPKPEANAFLRFFCESKEPSPLTSFTSLASDSDVGSNLKLFAQQDNQTVQLVALRGPQVITSTTRRASLLVAAAFPAPNSSVRSPTHLFVADVDLIEKKGSARVLSQLSPRFPYYEGIAQTLRRPLRSWSVLSEQRIVFAASQKDFRYVIYNLKEKKIEKTLAATGDSPWWNPKLQKDVIILDSLNSSKSGMRQIAWEFNQNETFQPSRSQTDARLWSLQKLNPQQWLWLEADGIRTWAHIYSMPTQKRLSWLIEDQPNVVISGGQIVRSTPSTNRTQILIAREKSSRRADRTLKVEQAELQFLDLLGHGVDVRSRRPYPESIVKRIEGLASIYGPPPYLADLLDSPLSESDLFVTLPSFSGYSLYAVDAQAAFLRLTISACLHPSFRMVQP